MLGFVPHPNLRACLLSLVSCQSYLFYFVTLGVDRYSVGWGELANANRTRFGVSAEGGDSPVVPEDKGREIGVRLPSSGISTTASIQSLVFKGGARVNDGGSGSVTVGRVGSKVAHPIQCYLMTGVQTVSSDNEAEQSSVRHSRPCIPFDAPQKCDVTKSQPERA
jgi:hypothetical protein